MSENASPATPQITQTDLDAEKTTDGKLALMWLEIARMGMEINRLSYAVQALKNGMECTQKMIMAGHGVPR